MTVQKYYLVTRFVGTIAVVRFTKEDFVDNKWIIRDSYYAICGVDLIAREPTFLTPDEAIAQFKKDVEKIDDQVVKLQKEMEINQQEGVPDGFGYEPPKRGDNLGFTA